MGVFTPVVKFWRVTEDAWLIILSINVFAFRILKMLQSTGCWVSFDITVNYIIIRIVEYSKLPI